MKGEYNCADYKENPSARVVLTLAEGIVIIQMLTPEFQEPVIAIQ